MTNTTKQAERLQFVSAIQSSVTDLVQQYELIAMYDEAIRADLVKPIQVDQKFKPVLYARFRNGEIDWAEDCVSSDNACVDEYIERQSDDEFYESVPLYSADTVHALQLEAIRKTLKVAMSRILDAHGKVQSPLYQLRQIDPEEILKGLTL